MLSPLGAELVVAPADDDAALVELAAGCDAILTNWRTVPVAALDAATRCVVITRYGIGLDNIPVEHATRLGIAVSNVPDFCVDEVSEHALALLLASARRIVSFAGETATGGWGLDTAHGIRRLRGQTLALVGYGRLAQALAVKAVALGLEVRVFTPSTAPGLLAPGIVAVASLRELLAEADVVSLHVPSTPETRHLIGAEELRLLKPTAYLINTARGALIDEAALERALEAGELAGAALDVLDGEPPRANHPLLGRPDVIVTPHAAFYSEEAIDDLTRRAAEQVAQALRGGVPANLVNPQVLEQSNCRLARR